MATQRISWASGGSPYVTFYMDADVVETQQAPAGVGYGRWRIRAYLRMSKGSGSFYGGAGSQYALGNGGIKGTHSANPFLPSGSTNWNHGPYDFWVNANSNGYWTGSSTTYPLQMRMAYGSVDETRTGSITLPRIAQKPGAPGTPTVESLSPQAVTLAWTAPSGDAVTNYTLELSKASDFSPLFYSTSTGTSRSKTVSGLDRVTTYYARVRGKNNVGTGPNSGTRTFTTPAEAPSAVRDLAGSTTGVGQVTLSWLAPTDNGGKIITGYEWEASPSSNFSTGVISGSTATLSAVVNGATPGLHYWIRVRAKNADATGGWKTMDLTIAAGAKVWTGSTFKPSVVKVWTGSTWKVARVYVCSDAGDPGANPPIPPTWVLAK